MIIKKNQYDLPINLSLRSEDRYLVILNVKTLLIMKLLSSAQHSCFINTLPMSHCTSYSIHLFYCILNW